MPGVLPHKACPCKKSCIPSQRSPAGENWQASLPPTMTLPARATPNPIHTTRERRSRSTKGDSKATHNGLVVTSTTELVTDVYCKDVIQEAKWKHRNIPESTSSPRSCG